eukprot:s112_g24.t1
MSCDLGRLKSASALRDWEEDRAKAFASWASASRELLESLRAAVDLGATQHLELQQLLSLRSVADRAYAQAPQKLKTSVLRQLSTMSLGWLTESSLIPKEPKSISGVGAASLLNLQAVVYERERKGNAKRQRIIAEAKAKNDGVEARNARDQQQVEAADAGPALVRARLEEKAKRYEAMAAGGYAGSSQEQSFGLGVLGCKGHPIYYVKKCGEAVTAPRIRIATYQKAHAEKCVTGLAG